MDKHSRLLFPSVSDKEKSLMDIEHMCVCLINIFSLPLAALQNNLECLSLKSVFEMMLYLLVKPKRARVKHLTASNSKKALIQG